MTGGKGIVISPPLLAKGERGTEAPGSAERADRVEWGEDGANTDITSHALGQNPRDISVEWRVILRMPTCPQPHDPPAHAQRLQKFSQLALYGLFVELAGIGAGGPETIEVGQRHGE